MTGYWFCLNCDDVVTMQTPEIFHAVHLDFCPQCHCHAAEWHPHKETPAKKSTPKPVNAELAKRLFDDMKKDIL